MQGYFKCCSLAAFAKPVPGFNAASACAGAEVAFTNTTTGNASATYKWDFGDSKTSTEKDPKHIFVTAGTYNVKLVVSVSGCQAAADSITKPVGHWRYGYWYPLFNG
jgi:hypothetical protein